MRTVRTLRDTDATLSVRVLAGAEGEAGAVVGANTYVTFPTLEGWVPTADLGPVLTMREWRLPLNMSDITALRRQFLRDRYNRWETPVIFTSSIISEIFERTDLSQTGGGAARLLNFARYGLEFNGVERAFASGPFTRSMSILNGSFDTEPDGLYLSELFGYDAIGTKVLLMRCGVYLDREGKCKDSPYTWRHSGSYAWAHAGNRNNDVVLMPKADAIPLPRPLPERKSFKPVTLPAPSTSIARRLLVPGAFANDQDHHYPCITKSGIMVCENVQGYKQDGLFEKHSRLPIVMGARNVARLPYPLVLKTRREGQTLVCGNGYIAQLDSTGAAKLMAGHCHKEAIYYNEPPTSVLDPRYIRRGKWDPAIPVESQIFHTPWGGAWVPRSILIDPAAKPIGGEQPHLSYTAADGRIVNGPLWLQTDATGCVWAVQFDGHDLEAEPYIYYFLPPGTLKDGFGLVTHGNSMYITERQGHCISEWDLDTRQKIGDVLATPSAGAVGYVGAFPRLRFEFNPGKTVADARQYPVCFPEGLDKFVDAAGDVWLYIASSAQQWGSRINLRTRAFEPGVVKPPATAYNRQGVGDYFSLLAVSPVVDGFGPPGTVFWTTYVNVGFGKPLAILPNGAVWGYFNYQFGGSNYPTALCVGGNRLTCADADGGIDQFHLWEKDIDKVLNWANIQAGFNDWISSGWSVKLGANGVGGGRTKPPYGENTFRDAYMRDFIGLAE